MIVHRSSPSSAAAARSKNNDPAAYLARGYTARWLGHVSSSSSSSSSSTAAVSSSNNSNNNNPSTSTSTTSALQPLAHDQIDKDIRHMHAYLTACQRYQQHYYAQLNRITAAVTPHAAVQAVLQQPSVLHQPHQSLPIRLDPDHDKRLAAQRKQMTRAEVIRETLEQVYVAYRAHYVELCQQVQQQQVAAVHGLEQLQQTALQQCHKLAVLRCQLQMARDMRACLSTRQQAMLLVAAAGDEAAGVSSSSTSSSMQDTITTLATDSPLLHAWNAAWQPSTKSSNSSSTSTSNRTSTTTTTTNKTAANKNNVVIPWKARVQPATPFGVPLLVATCSLVPEKTIACAGRPATSDNNKSHVNDGPLIWFPNHLPPTISDESDAGDSDAADHTTTTPVDTTTGMTTATDHWATTTTGTTLSTTPTAATTLGVTTTAAATTASTTDRDSSLREWRHQVALLQHELEKEGLANAVAVQQTLTKRNRLDESTTMMAVVRQETEAVLYRHNILLNHPALQRLTEEVWKNMDHDQHEHDDDEDDAGEEENVPDAREQQPRDAQEDDEEEDEDEEEEVEQYHGDDLDAAANVPRADDDDDDDDDDDNVVDDHLVPTAHSTTAGATTTNTATKRLEDADAANYGGDDEGEEEGLEAGEADTSEWTGAAVKRAGETSSPSRAKRRKL